MTFIKRAVYLALLMCAACNLSQQETSIITPTVATDAFTPTPEAALSTYTNSTYGYSIQYPAALELEGVSDSQYIWLDRQIYITVSDNDPEKSVGDAPVIDLAESIMIGEYTARRLSGYIGSVGGGIPQRYESFVIAHNNLYYQFIVYELKRGDVQPVDRTMNPVPPEAVALLEQMVASLRFSN